MSSIAQKVLVVIPTLNEERHIEACLDMLLSPDLAGCRVVIADGGSTDRTRAIVDSYRAEGIDLMLIDNPDRIQSAGINRAVESAALPAHEILVRCDAHSHYPEGFIAMVAGKLADRDAVSVVVPMDATGQTGFARAAAWVVDTPLGSGGSAHRGGTGSGYVDHGHHAAMRLDAFRAVGGYNAGFSHNEDAELDHRLTKAGGQIWLDAEARIGYVMRPRWSGLFRQYWAYGRGRAKTVRLHRMRPRLRQMIPAINALLLVLSLMIAPFWPWALLYVAAYLGALALVSGLGAVALGRMEGLWAGPALFAIHNAWGLGFIRQMLTGLGSGQDRKQGGGQSTGHEIGQDKERV